MFLEAAPVVGLTAYTAYTDLKQREVKHWPVVSVALYGIVYNIINGGIVETLIYSAGVFFMLIIVYVLAEKLTGTGFGGGDVKILSALSLFYGSNSILIILISCIVAIIYGIVYAIITKQPSILKTKTPFVPAVFIAVLIFSFLQTGGILT